MYGTAELTSAVEKCTPMQGNWKHGSCLVSNHFGDVSNTFQAVTVRRRRRRRRGSPPSSFFSRFGEILAQMLLNSALWVSLMIHLEMSLLSHVGSARFLWKTTKCYKGKSHIYSYTLPKPVVSRDWPILKTAQNQVSFRLTFNQCYKILSVLDTHVLIQSGWTSAWCPLTYSTLSPTCWMWTVYIPKLARLA